MRIAVGAVYQTLTRLVLQDAVPGRRVELRLGDHAGHAVGQRRDDAVAGAGDPAGIGGAPEDVVVVQVERVMAGDVMRHHRLVHMDRAFRPAGGAAGEMQQRVILRIGRRNDEVGALPVHQAVPVERVGHIGGSGFRRTPGSRAATTATATRIPATLRRYSGSVVTSTRPAPMPMPRRQRLGAEGGEQRRNDAFRLQRAEHGDVELGDAAGQHEDAFARRHAKLAQGVGEPVGLARAGRDRSARAAPRCGRASAVPRGRRAVRRRGDPPPRARYSGPGRPAARPVARAPPPR